MLRDPTTALPFLDRALPSGVNATRHAACGMRSRGSHRGRKRKRPRMGHPFSMSACDGPHATVCLRRPACDGLRATACGRGSRFTVSSGNIIPRSRKLVKIFRKIFGSRALYSYFWGGRAGRPATLLTVERRFLHGRQGFSQKFFRRNAGKCSFYLLHIPGNYAII